LEDLSQTKEFSSFITPILELKPRNEEQEQQQKLELKQLPSHLKYVLENMVANQ